jgi:hypothetical protein
VIVRARTKAARPSRTLHDPAPSAVPRRTHPVLAPFLLRGGPMRLARGHPASPYRVPPKAVPGTGPERPPRVEPSVAGVLFAVLGCSLVRFGLYVFRGERDGWDGILALAASALSAYYLCRLLRG